MSNDYHNTDECLQDTSPDCTLIQSYYELILKDFIYCYENNNDGGMDAYIYSIQRCLDARVNAAIIRGTCDRGHLNAIMTTYFFNVLLNDIRGQYGDRKDKHYEDNINVNLNMLVDGFNINKIKDQNGNLINIHFGNIEDIGNYNYQEFLNRILEYNETRHDYDINGRRCIDNILVRQHDQIYRNRPVNIRNIDRIINDLFY